MTVDQGALDLTALDAAGWRERIEGRFPVDESLVIPVLQFIHETAGYVPEAAIRAAAEHLQVSDSRVFGVASFYSQFRFEPQGANTMTVCRGTACHVRGSGAILRELEKHLDVEAGNTTEDGQFTLETVACIGSCALAPVVVGNGRVQGRQTRYTATALADALRASEPGATARPVTGPRVTSPPEPVALSPAELDRRIEEAKEDWRRLQEADEPAIYVGTATCGLAAGAGEVRDALEDELTRLGISARIVLVGCVGMCFAEPLVEIAAPGLPRVTYKQVSVQALGPILEAHLVRGEPIEKHALGSSGETELPSIPRLSELPLLRSQVRIALRNCGVIDPTRIDHYLARDGYAGFRRALSMPPQDVIEEVKASGLRGRGGGGFPAGVKWQHCRGSSGADKIVICNADEGDPGAFMDRSLLEGDPHAVLEGMCIAAYAIGAEEGYVYVRAEYPLAVDRLETAIAQMRQLGLLGPDILGSGFSFDIRIRQGAGAFVCGEATALVASIEGRRGMPRTRPPRMSEKGLFGKPTNINNVETYADVSSILREGAEWFAGFGTETSKGTKTFALTGKVNRSGLIEVPMGIKLGQVVRDIGGGISGGGKFKAAQTGGPSGGCIPAHLQDLPIDFERLKEAGSIMGSGGLVIMDESTCMVDLARYFLAFTKDESCGQCAPCREGTGRMLEILDRICNGQGRPEDLPLLEQLGRTVMATSLCGLGQTAPNPMLTTLQYFREEYEEHIERKHCRAGMCPGLVVAPCTHLCPAGVEAPRYVRLVSQGYFEDAYLVVREKLPLPSVCGVSCFHPCEKSCRRGTLDENIAVRALKDASIKYGGEAEERVPAATGPASGKSVAVIGSGPDGLTVAYYLSKLGRHDVTVFEALPEAGGALRYHPAKDASEAPRPRRPGPMTQALERDLGIITSAGAEIQTDSPVHSLSTLKEGGYDAVFIAAGADVDGLRAGLGATDESVHWASESIKETTAEGVFAGSAKAVGPASAVEAIAQGRAAAQAIDRYLGGSGEIDEHLAPAEVVSELPPLPVETGQRLRPTGKRSGQGADGGAGVAAGFSREEAIEEAGRCLRCDLQERIPS